MTDINLAIFKENLLQLMVKKKNAAYLQSPNKCYLINGNIFYKNVSYKNMSTLHKKPSLTRCVLQTIVAFNGLIKVTGTLVYIIVNNLKY